MNPEQLYRKQKKKQVGLIVAYNPQAYENKERERQKNRKVMSKKLDKEKIQARVIIQEFYLLQIQALEKEEAAGRMTIGMRQEKNNVYS